MNIYLELNGADITRKFLWKSTTAYELDTTNETKLSENFGSILPTLRIKLHNYFQKTSLEIVERLLFILLFIIQFDNGAHLSVKLLQVSLLVEGTDYSIPN